ncbi:monovalent cation/H(+) antiporter subunit G [Thermodesulfovibrionales bacterium]|nr:monovalent cation/H(+) antiporter subunit G [Thermodesulfovibrionales bacterium]MCL0035620.1 monovalent cation/H(+) antiporter subunit G [Thermodesulfovibrionales bacterium]MCL0039983.1 monovalent cation/H(+) antiporter subunit G [Thermodesulfovibrionales bacterium]MCL0082912.1 monovalent cation/H(+) antiporter subunit G [Thermodesulfovibrionales bacterium]MCL0085073.1 monovalent cation/H(+) antiporter subunit G [Thermodesulfovibrionales bacterium]
MVAIDIIAIIFISLGVFVLIVGTIGLLRLPDFYTRMHAIGKCDTLGLAMVLVGLALYEGLTLLSAKLLLIAVFLFIANATATHAITRAAIKTSMVPWTKKED